MQTTLSDNAPSTLLSPVSWHTYTALRDDLANTAIQLTFDNQQLEIMNPPLPVHGKSTLSLHHFILVLCDEMELNLASLGDVTLRQANLAKGVEPDNAYYIQHESQVRPLLQQARPLDLTKMPPPDLVVEVDITSPSLEKLPIYQAFKIPEVWQYNGQVLKIWILKTHQYQTQPTSPTFQYLPLAEVLTQFIQQSFDDGELAAMRAFRQWVREQKRVSISK